MTKTAIWAGVALIVAVLIAVTVLAAMGKDTTSILIVVNIAVVPLLAALGYSKLKGIEEKTHNVQQNTNGNMSRILDALLAAKTQPSSDERLLASATDDVDEQQRTTPR